MEGYCFLVMIEGHACEYGWVRDLSFGQCRQLSDATAPDSPSATSLKILTFDTIYGVICSFHLLTKLYYMCLSVFYTY